jgi:hypothetical protein
LAEDELHQAGFHFLVRDRYSNVTLLVDQVIALPAANECEPKLLLDVAFQLTGGHRRIQFWWIPPVPEHAGQVFGMFCTFVIEPRNFLDLPRY